MDTSPLQPTHDDAPSPWVARFASLVSPGGKVLDLACGRGRHTRFLARRGFAVEAVDRDASALAALSDVAGVTTRLADLEGGPWPYFGSTFDGVVVANYLHRPLLPNLFNVLGEGGVLIYETFMVGNERFGKPENPAYLLRSGELLELVRKRFNVVAFEQGIVEQPRTAAIQRICVRRGADFTLPGSLPPGA